MARYSGWGLDLPFKADSSLSASQWSFVTTASRAGYVKVATGGSGPMPIGVLQNDPLAEQEAVVRILGSTKVRANIGGAISYGSFVTSSSQGSAELAAASGVGGIAMEALASGSAFIEILLVPFLSAFAPNA